jgi:hypothetical protein
MQKGELNLITVGLAKRTEISGRATADQRNHNLPIEKGKNLRCLACSTLIGFAILFFTLPSAPARANEDSDLHRGREDNDKCIYAEIAALQAQVTSLQPSVSELQGQVRALQTANTSLQTSNTALETRLAAVQSNHALLIGPFVSVASGSMNGVNGPQYHVHGSKYSYRQRCDRDRKGHRELQGFKVSRDLPIRRAWQSIHCKWHWSNGPRFQA